jgi:multidrug resistance efflux pump
VEVDTTIVAEGRLEPVRYAEPAFSASGVVEEVLVIEGDLVAEGDLLAHLENTDVLAAEVDRLESQVLTELEEAYRALRVAQEDVDNYSIPTEFDGMTPDEAAAAMKVKVDEARADYEPYFGYDNPRGYVKTLEEALEDAWADYNRALEWMEREAALHAAEVRLAQAQADYENLQSGEYSAVQSELSSAQLALENAELRAPIAGTIANLDLKAGESVTSGQSVVTVADFSNWQLKTTDLTELDVVKLEEGQKVTITLDALPDTPLTGTVQSIGETFTEKQGDIVYEVTITLDSTDPAMRWGMTALVEFVE